MTTAPGASAATDLGGLLGWVADVVATLGPLGVGLLVALENVFPPVPSEIVLPFAGFASARGAASLPTMVAAATAGSVAGAVVLYELGRRLGQERIARVLQRLPLVDGSDVRRSSDWFHRHGALAVFTGRFLPFVRSVVSLPAGADPLPRLRFLVLTALGSAIWNTTWIVGGYVLGRQWRTIGRYSDLLNAVVVAAVVVLVARFVWRRRHRLGSRSDETGA